MKTNSINSGIGFVGVLQILFIALKLTNVINWSWWWVLSPTIITWILILALFTLIVLIGIYVESKWK